MTTTEMNPQQKNGVNGDRDMSSIVVRSRKVFKRNSMRFAAALLVALAGFVAAPNAALAAAPQHHDQVPGFARLKVDDLEVTSLFDASAVFDPHWLNGEKATMDDLTKALHQDPHLLDTVDSGFLVNTGKQMILIDAGEGTWWGPPGRVADSLRSAGYTPEQIDLVLLTHLHADHIGGLHHSGRKSCLSKCRCLCREGRKRLLAVAGNRR
jgi:beta-lactamase superfamily II metal-dependent hydrolase